MGWVRKNSYYQLDGGRRLPPSIERLWLGELRRAHAIIHIISFPGLLHTLGIKKK
jgi:hypothetical protein